MFWLCKERNGLIVEKKRSTDEENLKIVESCIREDPVRDFLGFKACKTTITNSCMQKPKVVADDTIVISNFLLSYLNKTRLAPSMKSARGRSSSVQRPVRAWSAPPRGAMFSDSATTDLWLAGQPMPIHLFAVVLT